MVVFLLELPGRGADVPETPPPPWRQHQHQHEHEEEEDLEEEEEEEETRDRIRRSSQLRATQGPVAFASDGLEVVLAATSTLQSRPRHHQARDITGPQHLMRKEPEMSSTGAPSNNKSSSTTAAGHGAELEKSGPGVESRHGHDGTGAQRDEETTVMALVGTGQGGASLVRRREDSNEHT